MRGLHPDDVERVGAAVVEALDPAGPRTLSVEYRTIGIEDGVERQLVARGLALFDGDVPRRLIRTVQDLQTECVQRERGLISQVAERTAERDRMWIPRPI